MGEEGRGELGQLGCISIKEVGENGDEGSESGFDGCKNHVFSKVSVAGGGGRGCDRVLYS